MHVCKKGCWGKEDTEREKGSKAREMATAREWIERSTEKDTARTVQREERVQKEEGNALRDIEEERGRHTLDIHTVSIAT